MADSESRVSDGKMEAACSRFPAEVPALLSALRQLKADNPKACRSNVHLYPASVYAPELGMDADRHITSWKMTEHLYFKKDNGFPTLARGLFTEQVKSASEIPPAARASFGKDEDMSERIVARGYDKFFNTDEMAWTSWEAIARHSLPPYHLTLKSNGCLILISALSPKHILIASKHSLGTTTETSDGMEEITAKLESAHVNDNSKSAGLTDFAGMPHAEVGREWVRRTLKRSGRTSEELAQRLWDENVTAVLELCDDSFEEHVIATPEYWTGLHLHGLNHNTPHFATKTPEEVSQFAKDFGFIETKHLSMQSAAEVKSFTDEIAKTGTWQGEMIEGFVVRSTVAPVNGHQNSAPPYQPGAPFFFKVKFDEPYLLYRQFRETTRHLLPLLQPTKPEKEADIWKRMRARTRRQEVGVYAEWCGRMLAEEPSLFDNYERGVVRVRERFLQWIEGEGKAAWDSAKAGTWKFGAEKQAAQDKALKDAEMASLPKKWVIVPVAVPGCGKTLLGNALNNLFGFGHTQSDDVVAKKTAPTFKKNIVELLKTKDVVYADRNNHIDKHYTELSGLAYEKQYAKALKPYNVRLIGIVWDIDSQPYHRLLRLASERVVQRGDNHQTLRPDATVDAEHEAIVSKFLHNFTTPDPTIFDKSISISIEDEPREALAKAVNGLVEVLGIDRPSEAAIDEALAAAMKYRVTTPYHAPERVGKTVRYFGLAPEIDINEVVDEALASPMPKAASDSANTFMSSLREKSRVTQKPHITLVHEKNCEQERESLGDGASPGPHAVAWDICKTLAEGRIPSMYDFDVTHLAWDDRVMALVVGNIRPQDESGLQLVLPAEVKANLHITVGTQGEDISAFESRSIVRAAREAISRGHSTGEGGEAVEGGGPVHWVGVGPIEGVGRVRGMF